MLGYKPMKAFTPREIKKLVEACRKLDIQGLVFVGGPKELSHVALL